MALPPLTPTPYAEVNAILAEVQARVTAILGPDLLGMYLYGSLALGDFTLERGSDAKSVIGGQCA